MRMKEIHFYFDVISPYAWLAFQALPKSLDGIAHRVHYHPVVFGAMLKHHGQLGPAEMPGKRDWTYRQVMQQSQPHFQMDIQSPEVKQQLLQQTQAAIDLGLFGVPSMVVDGQIFWGQDALPMLRAYLEGDAWFESSDWRDVGQLPVGIRRAT